MYRESTAPQFYHTGLHKAPPGPESISCVAPVWTCVCCCSLQSLISSVIHPRSRTQIQNIDPRLAETLNTWASISPPPAVWVCVCVQHHKVECLTAENISLINPGAKFDIARGFTGVIPLLSTPGTLQLHLCPRAHLTARREQRWAARAISLLTV